MRAAKGHAKHRASGAAWVAKSECCQFYYQNRQSRQRLVKRSTGEARTVWAAIRRRCQFKRYNRQCLQHKVAGSVAESRPAGCGWQVLSISTIIGISLSVLNNYFSKLGENDEPIYKNKKCTIRKGTLYVKPTTRGRKKQND